MPEAVAGEKGDALAAQRSDHVRRRRIAKRCADMALFAIGELRHVVQTAPPMMPMLMDIDTDSRFSC